MLNNAQLLSEKEEGRKWITDAKCVNFFLLKKGNKREGSTPKSRGFTLKMSTSFFFPFFLYIPIGYTAHRWAFWGLCRDISERRKKMKRSHIMPDEPYTDQWETNDTPATHEAREWS